MLGSARVTSPSHDVELLALDEEQCMPVSPVSLMTSKHTYNSGGFLLPLFAKTIKSLGSSF